MRAATPLKKFGSSPGEVKTKDFQFGGALGGPIIQDVMHFFVTYEGKRQEIPREITQGMSLPVSYFPSEYQSALGSTTSTFNAALFFGKIDTSPPMTDMFEILGNYHKARGEILD